MADLYPTKTRLGLLADVQAGYVHRALGVDENGASRRAHDGLGAGFVRVNAQMRDLERAGWVRLPRKREGQGSVLWELTEAGRTVLEANRGC